MSNANRVKGEVAVLWNCYEIPVGVILRLLTNVSPNTRNGRYCQFNSFFDHNWQVECITWQDY